MKKNNRRQFEETLRLYSYNTIEKNLFCVILIQSRNERGTEYEFNAYEICS